MKPIINLRYNGENLTTVLEKDGKNFTLNCLGNGEGHNIDEWKGKFFPDLVKTLNLGEGSECKIIFFGDNESYTAFEAELQNYTGKNTGIEVELEKGEEKMERGKEEECKTPVDGESEKPRQHKESNRPGKRKAPEKPADTVSDNDPGPSSQKSLETVDYSLFRRIQTFDVHFDDHKGLIRSVAFSPNGKYIASGVNDKTVMLWEWEHETKTLRRKDLFEGHEGWVRSVAFSHDGKFIVSGSQDKTVKLWEIETRQCVHTFKHNGWVRSVAFSHDGKFIET